MIWKICKRACDITILQSSLKNVTYVNDIKFKGYFDVFEAYEMIKEFEDNETHRKKILYELDLLEKE